MFCPKCRDEFREGFTHCATCDEALVEALPPMEKRTRFTDDGIPLDDIMDISVYSEDTEAPEAFYVTDDSPALLCTVNNNTEVAFVESLMRSNHIPVMKKWRNGGDAVMIYMAVSFTGADIYVPSKLLSKAKTLLEPDMDDTDKIDNEFVELFEKQESKRREKARMLLLLAFVVPVFFLLLVVVLMLFGMW